VEVNVGDTFHLRGYELTVREIREGDNPNYSWQHALIDVKRNGKLLETMEPENRFFNASQQQTHEVDIRRRLNEDLYLNFAGPSNVNPSKWVIQAYVFPLVSWIWLGFAVLVFGTLICLVPSKVRLQYARTEVVEVTPKHAPVTR
jgi:cytochrome c-type biogenesis protein CcmF